MQGRTNVDMSRIGPLNTHLGNFSCGSWPSKLVDIELHCHLHPSA